MAHKIRTISKIHGPVTEAFLAEVETFRFHFSCEECVFFNTETEDCVHMFPNDPHRAAYFADNPVGKVLIFCREFDLK